MKFQVGDLVLVKECKYKTDLYLHPHLYLHFPPRLYLDAFPHLKNTYGVITEVISHRDAWERDSTEDDNIYVWYSQIDAKTYYFCENELTQYEVVK
jgi:uncharacterized protein YodC (DUF2158 family)